MKMTELTAYEIAEAFPDECKQFIPRVLPVLKSKTLNFCEAVRYIKSLNMELWREQLSIDIVKSCENGVLNNRISVYEKVLELVEDNNIDKYSSRAHLLGLAKKKRIEDIYNFSNSKVTGNRIHVSCPFHGKDKHPSMVIYRENNSFHCFTCKASGDSIDFFMLANKVGFSQAVKVLSK